MSAFKKAVRGGMATAMVVGLAACADMDTGRFGGGGGPQPDSRGVITYPTYQAAVARPGDTVRLMAERLGQDPVEMARLNGVHPDAVLGAGATVILPKQIETLGPDIGGPDIGGPVRRPGSVDVETLAGNAINEAESQQRRPIDANEVRHIVRAGETVEGIAARYGVKTSELMRMNALKDNNSLRAGQILRIPAAVSAQAEPVRPAVRPAVAPPAPPTPAMPKPAPPKPAVTAPGQQSPVTEPPSASTPLPKPVPAPAPEPKPEPQAPADTRGTLTMPVKGTIIRDFKKGVSDGIDISAAAGSPVVAAADGTVAAITRNTEGVPILVIRHADGLFTVYAGIDELTVKRDDKVSRGQQVAKVRAGDPPFLHFETRRQIESVDPADFL